MERRPRGDVPPGSARSDSASQQCAIKGKGRVVASVLGVKVRGIVLLVVHPDQDAEECGDDGHRVYSMNGVWGARPNALVFSGGRSLGGGAAAATPNKDEAAAARWGAETRAPVRCNTLLGSKSRSGR